MTPDRQRGESRGTWSSGLQAVLRGFEGALYVVVCLLLITAAGFVLVESGQLIVGALFARKGAIETGVLVLDRILLILIVAELGYTLRVVIRRHEISAEPFLFIGLIAAVRRILIVGAEFEQPQPKEELLSLLYQLGMLGVLVISIALAIFLIRRSAASAEAADDQARDS